MRISLPGDHAATMVEIVMPALVRVFRAVDKDIFIYRWMNGHHANVRALSGTVEDLNLSRLDIHPLDGFAGKRGARGTNVKDQPPAVRRPGARVGKLMMTGSKGDLFHKHTLMRDFRIRVSYRKELAYSFDIPTSRM